MKRKRCDFIGQARKRLHREELRWELASEEDSESESQSEGSDQGELLSVSGSERGWVVEDDDHDEVSTEEEVNHNSDNEDQNDDHPVDDSNGDVGEENVYVVVPPDEDPDPGLPPQDDNEQRREYVYEKLKEWAEKGVSFKKVDALLKILRPIYPNLDKSSRTLLETPRDLNLDSIGGHEGWYKGIKKNLDQRVTDDYFDDHDSLEIDVFMDSFKPFKSSQVSFWAILGCLADSEEVFIIQVSKGRGHPEVEGFFERFVNECNDLILNGFTSNFGQCPFYIGKVFADAVGRAYIKAICSHAGHNGCERCDILGFRHRRVYEVFIGQNGRPRTDESFVARRDRQHHSGDSPLEVLGLGMISQVPLEGLHLVDEGCMKRWLKQIMGKLKIKRGAIGAHSKNVIELLIPTLSRSIPSELNRRPRTFADLGYFKASEFRRILLYDGVKLFKHLDPNLYNNFLHLHSAITILSNPDHVQSERMLLIAERLLTAFCEQSEEIFGQHFVVYNIHSAKHLPDECRRHGAIMKFSAYKFESYFANMKRALRASRHEIQQLRNRDHERSGLFPKKKEPKLHPGEIVLSQKESFQLLGDGIMYKKLRVSEFCLATNRRDCCFLSVLGEVICISEIVHTNNGNVVLKGRKFSVVEDYYQRPIPSSLLDIFKVSSLIARVQSWDFQMVKKKCVLFSDGDGDGFVCIPLVHCVGEF